MARPTIAGYISKPLSSHGHPRGASNNHRRAGSARHDFERLYSRKFGISRTSNQSANPLDAVMFQLEQLGIDDARISQIQQMAEEVAANGTDPSKMEQSLSRTLRIIRENAIGNPKGIFDAMVRKIREIDNTKAVADLRTLFIRLRQLGIQDDKIHRLKKLMGQLEKYGVSPSQQVSALNGVLKTAIGKGIGEANTISDAMEQILAKALMDLKVKQP